MLVKNGFAQYTARKILFGFLKRTIFSGNPSLSNDNATDSICPYGWQLPTYSGDKSFQKLTIDTYQLIGTSGEYPSPELRSDIMLLSFFRSGYYLYDSGALNARGTGGYYWSAQSYASGTTAVYLRFSSTDVYPQYGNYRGRGHSLRCLAR